MKQKDVALIIIVVFISATVSLFISNMFFGSSTRKQQVAVVPTISSAFQPPDSRYFNSSSIDPTQLIQIGNTTNTNPFNGTRQ